MLNRLNKLGIPIDGIFREPDKISPRKMRVISTANNQQMIRVDKETRFPISKESEDKLLKFVKGKINRVDAVILSDYMKGVLTETLSLRIIKIANSFDKPIIVDPKGREYQKYKNSTIITPNKKEVELALKIKIREREELREAAEKLNFRLKTDAVLITLGREGMMLFERGKNLVNIKTKAKEVYDVTGAGDTVVALLGMGIASGLTFKESAEIANIAAGVVVGKVGTASPSKEEILEYAGRFEIHFNNKLKERETLKTLIEQEKVKGKIIVFTNGCFDLFHVGHIKSLKEAKSLGDVLVLGLNSDESVRRIKGKRRPIMCQKDRAEILSALDCIDYITIFDEETPLKLIESLKPDILVKGKDYKKEEGVGWDVVSEYGGRVVLLDLVGGVSTSALINRIVEGYKDVWEIPDCR